MILKFRLVKNSTLAAQSLKGRLIPTRLAVSLKRYPDTKLSFSANYKAAIQMVLYRSTEALRHPIAIKPSFGLFQVRQFTKDLKALVDFFAFKILQTFRPKALHGK